MPESALVRSADRTVVVTVDAGDIAHVVPVEVLGRSAGRVAVAGEVHAGDRVIVDGAFNLPDGAHVVAEPGAEQGR